MESSTLARRIHTSCRQVANLSYFLQTTEKNKKGSGREMTHLVLAFPHFLW
jgi:hypothetical protein